MLRVAVCAALLAASCFSKPERVELGADATVVEPGPDASAEDLSCVAAGCAGRGGTCAAGTCVIDHQGAGSVTCPDGVPCRIVCNESSDCSAVACGNATSCDVQCVGNGTCAGGVSCGTAATCDVTCRGMRACENAGGPSVACGATSCTVTCDGKEACADGIDTEPGGACEAHCCGRDACLAGVDTCTPSSSCS